MVSPDFLTTPNLIDAASYQKVALEVKYLTHLLAWYNGIIGKMSNTGALDFEWGLDNMQPVVWTVIGLIAYIGGLAIILTMTPRLLKLRFDEGLFMGIAAADVFGGLLAFAPVGLTFALFNGAFGIRVLDFLLLVGVVVVALRIAVRSFRPRYMAGTFQTTRMLAGGYGLLLLAAALYSMVLLILPSQPGR